LRSTCAIATGPSPPAFFPTLTAASGQIAWPFLGDDTVAARVAVTGNAIAEII
jgi:hypothetical protein